MKKDTDNLKLGRIMIVDDEFELMTALCESLTGQGYETTGFPTGADALKVLVEQDYDLLLTDLMMPEMDGIALLKSGLEIDPNLVCIIMTGHGTVQTAVEAMKKGAFDYILKPFKLNALMPVLSRAMEVRSLRMDNIQLRETVAIHELGKAIAFSSDLNDILNKVADTTLQQCTADEVSIMLPTCDGKELYVAVARGGHRKYIGQRVPMEKGVSGWAARNHETLIMNGKVDDPRFSPVNPRSDIHAAISMPMMAGGNLVGVLNVNFTKSHRHITLGQVKALSILVSIIAPILENTWLNIRIRKAEEQYRSIFENATEGIYQTTPEGQFITANTAMAVMLGYGTPEKLMSAVTDIASQLYVNPEEWTKIKLIIKDAGHVKSFETQFYRKDGGMIWVSINTHAVWDKKENLLNYDSIAEDISERKLAERQQVLTGRVLEILNLPTTEILSLIRNILLLLKEHTGIEAIGIRLRDGEDFPYFETNGFPPHFVKAENYLCARDNAGEIIRHSNGNPWLECMCGNIVCGRTDPTFPFFTKDGSFWTNSTTELLASTSEEDRQSRTRNRCNSEGYESVALIPLRAGREIIGLMQFNDHRLNQFTVEMIRFLEGLGASIGIALIRNRAEEELRKSQEKFRSMVDNIGIGVALISPGMKILELNHQMRVWFPDIDSSKRLICYRAFNNPPRDEICDYCPTCRTLQDGKVHEAISVTPTEGDSRNYRIVSSPIFDANGKVTAAIEMIDDITERISLESQLRQSQKMEAIGTLAGGVAHDFNNILTTIIGNASLALQSAGKDDTLREEIEEIKTAGERAASLTRQLLAFSRKQIIQPKVLDLNELLTNIEKMLGRLVSEDVELLTILEPALWPVQTDPGQMEQVIMNLVVNAKDAMPQGGKLTIETANMDLDESYFREHGIEKHQGSYVMLAVSDTGIGMDKEIQEHIFEPFFTTKEIGKGTGLGLSTIYGIVKQNNGFIWTYSEPGQGSTFKIYLPKVKLDAESGKKQPLAAELGGSETILLVEDDDSLRKLAQIVLKKRGYKLLEAENGEDALRVIEAHDGSIDLLITDVVMPKMGGREVAERLQPLYPHMKVLYMSGYTDNAIVRHGVLAPGLNFIEKPFKPDGLARKVREILNSE